MTTARRPTIPPADLAVTLDECEPVRAEDGLLVVPTCPTLDEVRATMGANAAADEALHEWQRAMHDRTAALEAALPSAATNARWIRRGVYVGGGLLGLGGAVFAWALASARAHGDAEATIREREAERRWLVDSVRALERNVAEIRGELRARNPLGAVPLIGPPDEPKEPAP